MKPQFFVSSMDGALHDTRDSDWARRPLRRNFQRHFSEIQSLSEVKACLRAGSSTDLGGYPLFFVTRDGAALSYEAVRKEWKNVVWDHLHDASTGWRISGCRINEEDADLVCDHTGERISCAWPADEDVASPSP